MGAAALVAPVLTRALLTQLFLKRLALNFHPFYQLPTRASSSDYCPRLPHHITSLGYLPWAVPLAAYPFSSEVLGFSPWFENNNDNNNNEIVVLTLILIRGAELKLSALKNAKKYVF